MTKKGQGRRAFWLARSALTTMGDPGGFLPGGDASAASGLALFVVVLLSLGEQVGNLLLQLGADGVLSQDQHAQTGGVVLHHFEEDLKVQGREIVMKHRQATVGVDKKT